MDSGLPKQLRILFLGNIAPYRIGGAEVQARWLCECFARRGHQVAIASYSVPDGRIRAGKTSDRIIETIHLPIVAANRLVRIATFCISMLKLLLVRKGDFDLVFCCSFKDATLVVALLKRLDILKLPVVVRCEGFGVSGDARFLKALPATRWFVHLSNKTIDRVNSIAPRIQNELTSLGLKPGLFCYIPNGVPLPPVQKPVPFPNHGPRSILFAGRMVPKKGASDLLLAAKELMRRGAEFRVNLVGAGPLSEYLKYQARLLGIDTRIRFHGLVDPDQMPCFYRDNHFLVLPSLQEPFGMVAVEAMSHGRPVVVTRSGGPEYYVDRLVGRVCPAGDVFALADAMQEMIDMPLAALQEMGLKARERVEARFNIEDTSNRFLELFYEVAL